MKKREFMNILDRAMLGMDYDEKRGILNDYDEHFQIALQEGKTEEEITRGLGDPNEIAKNYIQRTNTTQATSDYEEAKEIDLSKFNTINNENNYTSNSFSQGQSTENSSSININEYKYNISDVENINALLSISDIEVISKESDPDENLIMIEVIYPAMMNKNLEQYRIAVEQTGNSVNINQKKRIMNFLNHFVLKEIPKICITVPKSAKLNKLSLSTERGNIYAKNTDAHTLNLNNISGSINAETLKALDAKITTISGSLIVVGLVSENAKVSSVSGSINTEANTLNIDLRNVSGSSTACIKANSIHCHNVSGSSNVQILSKYENATLNAVSGSLTLYVPDNVSFNASYSSVSGHVSTDFSEISNRNKNGCFNYIAQEESSKKTASIQLSTVSGQMAVMKISAR